MVSRTELTKLREAVQRLQVEVNGRKAISAMVVWDGQNESSVNPIPDEFSGLVVHLTPEPSQLDGTVRNKPEALTSLEFEELKQELGELFSR